MSSVQTITKTITISPGESFTLPAGATVTSITDVLDTTCNVDLPTPEPLLEYNYIFSLNEDNTDDNPMGSEVNIESLLVDGAIIPLSFTFLNTDNSPTNQNGVAVWSSEISTNNNLLNSQAIKFVSITWSDDGTKHDLVTIVLKMPSSFLSKVFVKIRNDKFPNGLYLNGSV